MASFLPFPLLSLPVSACIMHKAYLFFIAISLFAYIVLVLLLPAMPRSPIWHDLEHQHERFLLLHDLHFLFQLLPLFACSHCDASYTPLLPTVSLHSYLHLTFVTLFVLRFLYTYYHIYLFYVIYILFSTHNLSLIDCYAYIWL